MCFVATFAVSLVSCKCTFIVAYGSSTPNTAFPRLPVCSKVSNDIFFLVTLVKLLDHRYLKRNLFITSRIYMIQINIKLKLTKQCMTIKTIFTSLKYV